MYEQFYGLRELPFELSLDPKYLYLTASHREALSTLEYGLSSGKAVTVLTGEAGTGKTTLLRAALTSPRCRNVGWIALSNPAMTREEFVHTLARRFGLSADAARSKAVLLEELERLLHERRRRGELTALVVDEAQSLSTELLEEIRLLANIETSTEKLLSLVLVGQPELGARLNDPRLRQLKQRVALRSQVVPLDLAATGGYIEARMSAAGGSASDLFTREAVALVHQYSRGIPRTISVICDNALVSGFALERRRIDTAIVLEVVRDFDLEGVTAAPVATAFAAARTLEPAAADVFGDLPLRDAGEPAAPPRRDRERELFTTVARPRRFAFFRS